MATMRRFSQETLARIRDRVSIPSLLLARSLRPCGDQLVGRCPLPNHEDRNPSFFVSLEKRRFFCHGCGRGGDVIELHRILTGASFPDAVKQLLERSGENADGRQNRRVDGTSAEARGRRPARRSHGPRTPKHRSLLEEVAARYRHAAQGSARFQDYLRDRGFDASHSGLLGYAPTGGLGLASDTKRRSLYRDLGLLDRQGDRVYERLRGGIVFTVTNLAGGIEGFVTRRLTGEPRYLNSCFSKRRFPLGWAEARKAILESRSVVLVEGPFDWLALRAMGRSNVLALLGSTLSPILAGSLSLIGVERVALILDADESGRAGARAAALVLRNLGIGTLIETLPRESQDPAELWSSKSN